MTISVISLLDQHGRWLVRSMGQFAKGFLLRLLKFIRGPIELIAFLSIVLTTVLLIFFSEKPHIHIPTSDLSLRVPPFRELQIVFRQDLHLESISLRYTGPSTTNVQR